MLDYFKYLILIIILILLFVVGFQATASAHLTEETLHCPLFSQIQPLKTPRVIGEFMVSSGLLAEVYDITGDGLPDVAIYSPTIGGYNADGQTLAHHLPLFIEVDVDGDTMADEIWLDRFGEGKCEDIALYKTLPSHEKVKGGLTNWYETPDHLKYDGRPYPEFPEEAQP